jgi:hypothetical protein
MARMSEGELKALLDSKITNAIGYQGGKLSQDRQQADRYYAGEPFGNELEGRSQVVSRTVAEAVDGMMPSLMKIFSSGDEVVKFEPEGPEDEEGSKQATDYVNWIWNKQNEGFANFFTWFKDSLLKKTAVVKIWWDESIKNEKESYEGLSEDEFNTLLADPDLELTEHTEYPDPNGAAAPPSGAMPGAGPMPIPSAPAAQPMSALNLRLLECRRGIWNTCRCSRRLHPCCTTPCSAASATSPRFASWRCRPTSS